jgi:peptidoglycan-associated lipoprotein
MPFAQPRQKYAAAALLFALSLAGCAKKKPAPAPAAPPPPAPAPTAHITAQPNSINAGQAVQLSWGTTNADTVNIDGVGQVSSTGSQTVRPTESTSYHIVAKGPGGTADDTVRVTVTAPPPPVRESAPAQPSLTDDQLLAQNVQDIFFDYDSYDLRPEDQAKVQQAAKFLNSQKPNWNIVIEGNCDDRGSTEYNLALGDNRANAAKSALVAAGVNASRIQTISFGKEKPVCTEDTESCWQQNRRDHFRLSGR